MSNDIRSKDFNFNLIVFIKNMIYIQEILFRFFYLSLTSFCVFLINFLFKEYILLFFINPLLNQKQIKDIAFLFSSPYELFDIYFKICLLSTFIIIIPFILYQILHFLTQGLNKIEYSSIKRNFLLFIITFYIFNILIICFLLPIFWKEVELFNIETLYFSYLNIEYEPNLHQYITFLYNNTIILNIVFFIKFIYFYIIKNINIKTYLKLIPYEKPSIIFIYITDLLLYTDIY